MDLKSLLLIALHLTQSSVWGRHRSPDLRGSWGCRNKAHTWGLKHRTSFSPRPGGQRARIKVSVGRAALAEDSWEGCFLLRDFCSCQSPWDPLAVDTAP